MRLLLVDDHAILREGLRAVLEAAGHEVVGESSSPEDAVAQALALRPDLMLLDITLGERSGIDVLQQLRDAGQVVPTVVLTMSAAPRHVSQCQRLGAMGYVLKGSPMGHLMRAIADVAQGRPFIRPELAELGAEAQAPATGNPFDLLSMRERQIALRVVEGASSAAIAAELNLSPKTVETYRSRLNAKLGVGDIASLVRLAVRHGLVDATP
jgi:DNA-binding NarL/FixJ family response regulator